MPLATLAAIRHTYGTRQVLDGVSLSVEPGERIGLVGRNGQGKSTLLRILAGKLVQDHGDVQIERGRRVGYLEQHPAIDPADTVRGAASRAFRRLHQLHESLEKVFDAMTTAKDAELERLLRQQAELERQLEEAGGYAVEHRIDAALHGVGFAESQRSQLVGTLSGGQKGRLALATLLLEAPDLLLLDEPTNHLDIDGRRWLESFLAEEFPGAVILVSHDRWLLDRVVHRIVEVEEGTLADYPGNYEDFRRLRRERQLAQARVHQKQLDRVRAEEAYIRRYKAGQRAKQARGRATRLERFVRDELVDRPPELDTFEVRLPPAPRVGDHVLVAEGLTKRFGDRLLFRHLSLAITPGERVGIVGPNGAGKTTLVRCLLGEEPLDEGRVRVSPQLRAAWFRQTQDHLDQDQRVWEYLQAVIVGEDGAARASEQQARDLAGAFLFSGADQDKRLGALSGGERARAVIAGLVAGSRNLLVLDEPTNHLDIPAAERLESALATDPEDGGFGGAIILISHDRALLDNVCDRLVVLDGAGGWELFQGGWREWSERDAERKARLEAEVEAAKRRRDQRPSRPPASAAAQAPAPRIRGGGGLERLSQEELEARIERLESDLKRVDARLADPELWKDAAKAAAATEERTRLAETLAPLEMEWTRRADDPD